ncbi:DUF2914 domain-containing protein [Patescibacteria group bacterium]|nr:DUF2914 domain-containing protein [Patescibacteria group bacterium]
MLKKRLKRISRYNELKKLYEKYERLLIPGMLLFGVAVDFVTFRAIKISTAFVLLGVYTIVAGAIIAFINAYDGERIKHQNLAPIKYLRLAAPLVVQFTFGALLSASLIFYWFSGTISVSWPFILIIAVLMASNEVLRHHYLKPTVQISVYFFILFSLSSLILPFVFNSISPWIFLLSGVLSLIVIYLYIRLLANSIPYIQRSKARIRFFVIAIFISMNAMYFLNVIPPIPLSLREAGVYHSVQRSGSGYIMQAEEESWLDWITPGQTMHLRQGDRLYVYTAVFAPADLDTKIYHRWEYYSKDEREWISGGRFSFSIIGGRENGYRGFSLKSNLTQGKWRVSVETERGQVLGRIRFAVEQVEERPDFKNLIR